MENNNIVQVKDRLCLACDLTEYDEIIQMVDELQDLVGYFKFHTAFLQFGSRLIKDVQDRGVKVFLDLKFHDIPNTLNLYARSCVDLGIDMFTVHISAGQEALEQTILGTQSASHNRPKVIGITVMTSIDQNIMNSQLRMPSTVKEQVIHFGTIAAQAKLDGIVCAATNLKEIKHHMSPVSPLLYVTPGIRPSNTSHNDQKQVMTPSAAIQAGSSMLVVGRAIYQANNRREATENILREIQTSIQVF